MRKPAPKRKKKAPRSKDFKSPLKAIRKIIKKIRAPKEKLVIKKTFSKFIKIEPPRQEPEQPWTDSRLPAYYAEDELVLMVRDPWWLFAYWEVTPGREAQVMAEISRRGLYREKTVLRVYDRTGQGEGADGNFFDIEIYYLNSNWYVDVGRPDCEWVTEIGIKTRDGQFFALVRSNVVRTPPFGISDVLDEEWMMPDEMYFKLLKVIGGLEGSGGSMDIRRLLEKYIRQSPSSENSSRFSKAVSLQNK